MWMTDVHMTDHEGTFGSFMLEADLVYQDKTGKLWTTPAGFVCDLSSIPGPIRPLISKTVLGKAPWLHDYLYRTQPEGVTRAIADDLFLQGALDEGMKKWAAWGMWLGLRAGGWIAWLKNR